MLHFRVFSVGGWHGDDSVVEVGFECEDIVGRIGYPAVFHLVVCIVGVGWLVWSANCEDRHVVNAHCEEG